MPTRIFLNQGLSNVYDAIAIARAAMLAEEFQFFASHGTGHTPIKTVADVLLLEPRLPNDEAYTDWLLGVCRNYGIDILWPQSRLAALFKYHEAIVREGIRIMLPCAEAAILAVVNDKQKTAEAIAGHDIALPRQRSFRTLAEFDAVLADLAGLQVCVKPAQSICAQGFRLLDERRDAFARFLSNDVYTIGVTEFRELLKISGSQKTFLAMEYLEGDERSIDCLVSDGLLVRCVVRHKPRAFGGRLEVIENNSQSQAIAAKVCRTLRLNGLINLQTRERILPNGHCEQCLLEVNARISGGVNMACLSGLNLPLWALRLAAGTASPADAPTPQTGLLVGTVYQPVIIEELPADWRAPAVLEASSDSRSTFKGSASA